MSWIDPLFYAWVVKERGALGVTVKGDLPGHEFHGNQYGSEGGSGGEGSSRDKLDTSGIKGSSPASLEKRAKAFNTAFSKSQLAQERKAKAEILKDGRLEYSAETGAGDQAYRIRLNYREALNLLNGSDMRSINEAMK